jgi:hypothetical protein
MRQWLPLFLKFCYVRFNEVLTGNLPNFFVKGNRLALVIAHTVFPRSLFPVAFSLFGNRDGKKWMKNPVIFFSFYSFRSPRWVERGTWRKLDLQRFDKSGRRSVCCLCRRRFHFSSCSRFFRRFFLIPAVSFTTPALIWLGFLRITHVREQRC